MNDDMDLWYRRFHPAPYAGTRLVCFPHAGGSASAFYALAERLAPEVEVLAVQYPGRQDRRAERGVDDIAELADRAFEAFDADDYGHTRLAFLGHSMGAAVAYEVALRLEQKAGVRLDMLFASGRRAPSRVRAERIRLDTDADVLAEIIALGGTDERLLADPELLDLILPVVRTDYTAIENYRERPGSRLSCPISVLVGDDDPRTTVDEAAAWAAHTGAASTVRVFAGGHFFLDAHLDEVADLIEDGLSRRPVAMSPVP